MHTCTQVGEMATWQRMAAIECNCTIEATLDKCVARVQNQVGVWWLWWLEVVVGKPSLSLCWLSLRDCVASACTHNDTPSTPATEAWQSWRFPSMVSIWSVCHTSSHSLTLAEITHFESSVSS